VTGSVRSLLKKGYELGLVSTLEVGTPFVRMLLLTHLLDLRELGFASALTASISAIELVTDIAINRFVAAMPRAEFAEALASAHALFFLRGVILSAIALAISPLIADAFSLRSEWASFAWLALVIFIRPLQNLAPKIAERDLQFRGQLDVTIISSVASLAAVLVVGLATHSHLAILSSLLAQTIAAVVVSRRVSEVPYRLKFRSPMFRRATLYSYPLMINGFALAVIGQGDRFLVGPMLDIQTLGVYSVILLATTVPIQLVQRVVGAITIANLFNTAPDKEKFQSALNLALNMSAFSGCNYAIGIVLLTNLVLPVVFGAKFVASPLAVSLIGLGAYVRIVRTDPFTALMLNAGRTKSLAIMNMTGASSLGYMLVFFHFWPGLEAFFAGRLAGELTGLVSAIFLARRKLGAETPVFSRATLLGLALTCVACLVSLSGWAGERWGSSLVALAGFGIISCLWGLAIFRSFWAARLTPPPSQSNAVVRP
jgi:O-antigen/teichoic acid export membrane protein